MTADNRAAELVLVEKCNKGEGEFDPVQKTCA